MKVFTKRYFGKIPLGFWVRRSICTTWTYRVDRGNGFYGTVLGERIQKRYLYNVPDPHADNVGVANKNSFAAAVAAWQSLSDEDKLWWDKEAQRLRLNMAGYHLYIRKYRLNEL